MKPMVIYRSLALMLAFSLSCNFLSQGVPTSQSMPTSVTTGDLSVEATSHVSVHLEWKAASSASGYKLEARYAAEFFPIADLPGEQTSYDHFVVPGSAEITYRLSAGDKEIGTATATMPELAVNPLTVGFQMSAPALPEFNFPTPDLSNFDPNNLENVDPGTLLPPGFDPNDPGSFVATSFLGLVSASQEIGTEGGKLSFTDSNQLVYTLDVPAGAVDEVTSFRLTSVTPIEAASFPFAGGSLGAIQIHPPLPFDHPLTLTIEIPAGQATSNAEVMIAFAASSFNNDFSLTPIYPLGANTYQMNVYWGDTFGLASAKSEEVKAQASRIPRDAAEQLAQSLAVLQAFSLDSSPETEVQIFAQIMEGLFQQVKDFRSQDSHGIRAKLAYRAIRAAVVPDSQSRSGAALWESIHRWERAWSEDQFNPLYDPSNPLFEPLDPGRRADLIVRLVGEIKAFLDKQQGCRRQEDFYIQALLQILINPESDFQQKLAENYRSRFGAPETKKKCTYQLHITRSEIEDVVSDSKSSLTTTVRVHVDPIPLEVIVRGAAVSLRGVGPVTYEEYMFFDSSCPPAAEIRPFPNSVIWITDLRPEFDAEGKVSNFALQGTLPDAFTDAAGTWTTEQVDGVCTSVGWESDDGENPDDWGIHFGAFHNPFFHSDTWTIVGDESYVATSEISGVQAAISTESTKMILTVSQEGQ